MVGWLDGWMVGWLDGWMVMNKKKTAFIVGAKLYAKVVFWIHNS
jgi:hypothetical protein